MLNATWLWMWRKEDDTWKKSSHRDSGPSGYVFGDVTRGIYHYFSPEIDESDDPSYSRLQSLLHEAVCIYKHRKYIGTITLSHTVGYFTETCSVHITKEDHNDDNSDEIVSARRIFDTLLLRLERRAEGWDNYLANINPSLTTTAQIGFRAPVINVGWGISVSLTITKSSLLHWKRSS